jgi:hypothetical protein
MHEVNQPKTSAAQEFRPRAQTLQARRLREFAMLDTHAGLITLMPGDWILTDTAGTEHGLRDVDFRRLYTPIDENGAALLQICVMDLADGHDRPPVELVTLTGAEIRCRCIDGHCLHHKRAA